MRILITGSRDWSDRDVVAGALLTATKDIAENPEPVTVVTGACPTGADKMAEDVAEFMEWNIETYPANWKDYGKKAGPIRNKFMVDNGADICLAFIKDDSKGASGTAKMAEEAGILTVRHHL